MAKAAFYVKCRPQGADAIALAKRINRVFIGYPPWKPDFEWSRHNVRGCIFDLTDASWTKRDLPANLSSGYRRQITTNRNIVNSVGSGSYVVVPRPQEGVCYIGKVTGDFELVNDPPWADDYLRLRVEQKLSTEPEESHIADVVQTWPVEDLRQVAFPLVPRWITYRLLSRNTVGIIRDQHGESAVDTLRALYEGHHKFDLTATRDVTDVVRRLVTWLTPHTFEHLVCQLLQLEHPDWHWSHFGGSGDGGADGLAMDRAGRVQAALQCKLRGRDPLSLGRGLRRALAETWGTDVKVYVAMLDGPSGARSKDAIEYWDKRHVAELLLKHAKSTPYARTLGIGHG